MRRILMLGVMACRHSTAETTTTDRVETPELNDVQAGCRASRNLQLGELARMINGPSCLEHPTMPLVLAGFDLGAMEGYVEARERVAASAKLCVCAQANVCDDAARMRAMEDVQRVMVDEDGKREREGAARVMSSTANNPCIDASIATETWLLGFRCAVIDGPKSRSLREERRKWYRTAGDERVAELEAVCE